MHWNNIKTRQQNKFGLSVMYRINTLQDRLERGLLLNKHEFNRVIRSVFSMRFLIITCASFHHRRTKTCCFGSALRIGEASKNSVNH